jgi:hypothetical protein
MVSQPKLREVDAAQHSREYKASDMDMDMDILEGRQVGIVEEREGHEA